MARTGQYEAALLKACMRIVRDRMRGPASLSAIRDRRRTSGKTRKTGVYPAIAPQTRKTDYTRGVMNIITMG
jgi:hypothetical protein